MAEKRMFSKRVIDTDEFLDMPATAQMLYFHLAMNADDDGFVGKPKTIMRMCRASEDDLTILRGKQFVISFESGVIVIRHWRIHNFIRKDTYHPTIYEQEKSMLCTDKTDAYSLDQNDAVTSPLRIRNESVTNTLRVRDESVTNPARVVDVDKNSIDKDSIEKNREGKGSGEKKSKEDLFETLLPSYQISEPLADKIREFMRYRKEQHRFTYREIGLKSFLRGAEKAEQEHGSIAVIKCFDETMRNGWQGVFYDKIKKEEAKESSLKDILKEKYARRGNEEV